MLFAPSTPTRSPQQHFQFPHVPANSSPLAPSSPISPKSSPAAAASTRRRSQYKSQATSSPTHTRAHRSSSRRTTAGGGVLIEPLEPMIPTEEAPRKVVLRERFKARCLERAQKDRERRISGRRYAISDGSSDGPEEVMDEDEDDESFINDELFRRIVSSTLHKQTHSYRLSYSHDVGSSLDPDMEDVGEWESELFVPPSVSTAPDDLYDEELATYAEEYDLHLEDLGDELWTLSDLDAVSDHADDSAEQPPLRNKGKGRQVARLVDDDIEMAM